MRRSDEGRTDRAAAQLAWSTSVVHNAFRRPPRLTKKRCWPSDLALHCKFGCGSRPLSCTLRKTRSVQKADQTRCPLCSNSEQNVAAPRLSAKCQEPTFGRQHSSDSKFATAVTAASSLCAQMIFEDNNGPRLTTKEPQWGRDWGSSRIKTSIIASNLIQLIKC